MGFFDRFRVKAPVTEDAVDQWPEVKVVPPVRKALDVPVQLGDLVRDVVTGYTGVATVWTKHLHGCDRLEVDATDLTDDGSVKDAFIFDIMRLEVLEQKRLKVIAPRYEFANLLVGSKVKDLITGIEGIVDARSESHSGDVFINLAQTTLDKDGKPRKGLQGMAGRFTLLSAPVIPVAAQAPKQGFKGGPVETRSASRAIR